MGKSNSRATAASVFKQYKALDAAQRRMFLRAAGLVEIQFAEALLAAMEEAGRLAGLVKVFKSKLRGRPRLTERDRRVTELRAEGQTWSKIVREIRKNPAWANVTIDALKKAFRRHVRGANLKKR